MDNSWQRQHSWDQPSHSALLAQPTYQRSRSIAVPEQADAAIGSVDDLDAAISSIARYSLFELRNLASPASSAPPPACRVYSDDDFERRRSGHDQPHARLLSRRSSRAATEPRLTSVASDLSASPSDGAEAAALEQQTAPTLIRITETEDEDDRQSARSSGDDGAPSIDFGRATPVRVVVEPASPSPPAVQFQVGANSPIVDANRRRIRIDATADWSDHDSSMDEKTLTPAQHQQVLARRFGFEYYGDKRRRHGDRRSDDDDEEAPRKLMRNELPPEELTPPVFTPTPRPDSVFIELDELYVHCPPWGQMEWRETGRWIKYEEHVEAGAERWSKPHVASLSFHSLLELRQCIERGTVLLELNVADRESLMNTVVDALARDDHVDDGNRVAVLETLLLDHVHVGSRHSAHMRRQHAHNSLYHYFYRQQSIVSPEPASAAPRCVSSVNADALRGSTPSRNGSTPRSIAIRLTKSFHTADARHLRVSHVDSDADRTQQQLLADSQLSGRQRRHQHHEFVDQELMRRLPKKSEAAAVMVGAISVLPKPVFVFVRLAEARHLEDFVEVPVPLRFFCMLIGPLDAGMDYHEVGRSMATLLSNVGFQEWAFASQTKADLIHGINEFMDDSIVLPPGDWEQRALMPYEQIKVKSSWLRQRRRALTSRPAELEKLLKDEQNRWLEDPLRRTGQFFGGLRREVSRRAVHYKSDFEDACSLKCAASVVFIFLTCFFPAITFGAILGESTKGAIGIKETLFATSIGGVLFSLISTQPILLLGVSGPMLIFEESVYNFCKLYDAAFLNVRIWVSVWAFIFCLFTVALEGPFFIRYVTRFSDDILSALVSLIFISECFVFLHQMFVDNPVSGLDDYCGERFVDSCNLTSCTPFNGSASSLLDGETDWRLSAPRAPRPNLALLSVVLAVTTCLLAIMLRRIRNSKYFGRHVRRALGDLGLSVSVVVVVLVDDLVFGDELATKLTVSAGVRPTLAERAAWFVRPWPVANWVPGATVVAGLLLFLILFVETEVCEMTLAKRSHNLRKGTGYHWDLLVSGALLVACSFFGLPWLCAVSVRSMAHLQSLTNIVLGAPGQKPRVAGVVDQRVTSLVLHVLIGLTLLATEVLRRIPVAVLFGVFLYLGVMNMFGLRMLSRTILFFVPVKHHPNVVYCLRVRTWRMNLFTVLQLACFVGVCLVKSIKAVAFAFPLAIMVAIAFRHLIMPFFFTNFELSVLDGEEGEQDEEPDFYEESRLPV